MDATGPNDSDPGGLGAERGPIVGLGPLLGIGVVVLALGGVALSRVGAIGPLNVVLFLAPGAIVLAGAWLLHRSELPPARYGRITGWTTAGAGGLGVVTGLMMLTPSIPIDEPAVATTLGVGVGAIAGLVAGGNEARAIVRAERAASERVATELADEQRERLEWVNHLLRHDILNDVTVIRARADAIAAEHGEGPHVRAIHRQVDSVTELIGNVRAFLERVEQADALEPIDLSETLAREVESLRSAYPEATVETEVPEGVTVTADDLLSSVFSNLLRNAVVHNRGDEPTVRVRTSVGEDTVTVRVADDGPGIPGHVRAEPFTAAEGKDHGFGLYLVGTLTERYGGTVEIERTGEDGTTIAVELPLADAALDAGSGDTAEPSAAGGDQPSTTGGLDDPATPEP